jgi:hypothetical protein
MYLLRKERGQATLPNHDPSIDPLQKDYLITYQPFLIWIIKCHHAQQRAPEADSPK